VRQGCGGADVGQLFKPLFECLQRSLGLLDQAHALFVGTEALFQGELASFEATNDAFQLGEALLKRIRRRRRSFTHDRGMTKGLEFVKSAKSAPNWDKVMKFDVLLDDHQPKAYRLLMLTTGGVRPNGLDGFTTQVYRTLESYVMSPWNVLKVACAKHGLDPLHISDSGLLTLIDQVTDQLEMITDAAHATDAKRALTELLTPIPTAAQLWESAPTRVVKFSSLGVGNDLTTPKDGPT
jgi:hypothetical protein